MLRQEVFLGIDGGGTHSTAIAVDMEGNVLAKVIGESINYYALGMQRARHHLTQIIEQIIEQIKIDFFDSVYIGNSALSQEASPSMIDEFTGGIIKSRSVYMHSDSYIALVAMTIGRPGILIISGTGSMGMAKGYTDELLTIGGWGHLLGDYGSAYHIAIQGIQAVVLAEDQMAKATTLQEALKRYYAVGDLQDLIDKFYNPPVDKHIIAGFASEVANCAEQGDEVALKLVKQAALDLAAHAIELEKRLNIRGVPIGASGSVFRKNSTIFAEFKSLLKQHCPLSTVQLIDCPPEFGAIYACFHKENIVLTPSIQERMKLTYEMLKEE
ncbi:BadF/BadG/BcrA/BcrD ATPase family protein [Paenibacillus sp. OV219]|uniref:BadF/BadG/BcrA/BcrD ATPase family protein n=1 Tax=Paenibacillus sp. OV219 TaxID=1884377 RepID=UPI0008B73C41|nr:BadF/BadG/BcrA/BcrD ATPase family protein [Paenibacillus sp. OV219]SEN81674.1 BadF-type ATPase [Paenibacillus sp. OV219]